MKKLKIIGLHLIILEDKVLKSVNHWKRNFKSLEHISDIDSEASITQNLVLIIIYKYYYIYKSYFKMYKTWFKVKSLRIIRFLILTENELIIKQKREISIEVSQF